MARIKTVEVRSRDLISFLYGGMYFCLCDKKNNLITNFAVCREELVGDLSCRHIDKMGDIDLGKTRLAVIQSPQPLKKKAQIRKDRVRGLLLVRCFEKMAGWKRSVLYKAKVKEITDAEVYIFVGPKEWISSPSALSLYSLLIRLGRTKDFRVVRGEASFLKVCESLLKKNKRLDPNVARGVDDPKEDLRQLIDLYEYLPEYVKSFSQIYAGIGPEDTFSEYTESGIRNFIIERWADSEAENNAADIFRRIVGKS